jgi:hypothetical protein
MDVLAKHKIGSTPVLRSHELGLRRVGRLLVKDEERRWGSEDPFPREVAPRVTGAHEGASLHPERGRARLRSGTMLRRVGAPRPGRSSPPGGGDAPPSGATPLRCRWGRRL